MELGLRRVFCAGVLGSASGGFRLSQLVAGQAIEPFTADRQSDPARHPISTRRVRRFARGKCSTRRNVTVGAAQLDIEAVFRVPDPGHGIAGAVRVSKRQWKRTLETL